MHDLSISDLFDFTFDNPNNEHRIIDLGIVDNELAEKIKNATGIDVKDFVISMDNYGIRHTIERHGNITREENQGQIAVQLSDFELITKIILEADTIIYDPRQKNKNSPIIETFIFEKQIDSYYYVLKEVRRVQKKGKKNRIMLQTMYITKKRRTF